jgi:hypothetical protein
MLALILSAGTSIAQTVILTSYGQGGQDAGIDVIMPGYPVSLQWSQSIFYPAVSISVGLASFGSSGTGWATLSSGAGLIASTDFSYPNNYGQINLFDSLDLPAATYNLNIGAYTGDDVGWGVPAGDTLYTADNVTYLGTFTHWGDSYPVDFSIVSVPEPSARLLLELGLLAIANRRLRTKILCYAKRAAS